MRAIFVTVVIVAVTTVIFIAVIDVAVDVAVAHIILVALVFVHVGIALLRSRHIRTNRGSLLAVRVLGFTTRHPLLERSIHGGELLDLADHAFR